MITGSTVIAGVKPMAEPWTLVIHGGAGTAAKELASPARLRAMRAALEAGAACCCGACSLRSTRW